MTAHRQALFAAIFLLIVYPWRAQARPESVSFVCLDAHSNVDLVVGCTASMSPATTDTPDVVKFDLLQPTIDVEIRPKDSERSSRQVRINGAAFNSAKLLLKIYLAKPAPPGMNWTLGDINDVRRALEGGEIDRSLALLDEISVPDSGSTFATRFRYWKTVALFRACTRLFYDTCDDARAAKANLLSDMDAYPKLYKAERVDKNSVRAFDTELDVAAIRTAFARAHWYQSVGAYTEARTEYDIVLEALEGKPKDFVASTRIRKQTVEDDIALLKTLMAAKLGSLLQQSMPREIIYALTQVLAPRQLTNAEFAFVSFGRLVNDLGYISQLMENAVEFVAVRRPRLLPPLMHVRERLASHFSFEAIGRVLRRTVDIRNSAVDRTIRTSCGYRTLRRALRVISPRMPLKREL